MLILKKSTYKKILQTRISRQSAYIVPPKRIELLVPEPESGVLSIKLWGQTHNKSIL